MGTNGFREDELISKQVNGQPRVFPVVGGRLRLAHEENQNLTLQTEMVSWDGQYAVFKCCAITGKGSFIGYGTANSQRDARLAESLIELAETRSVARALRFAGFGLEFTGAEEIAHIPEGTLEPDRSVNKHPAPVFSGDNDNGKSVAKPGDMATTITTAQVKALHALTRKARYTEHDVESLLAPLHVSSFQDLSRQSASQLIAYLQTEVAA